MRTKFMAVSRLSSLEQTAVGSPVTADTWPVVNSGLASLANAEYMVSAWYLPKR